jgi:hypothetical protein
MPVGATVVRCAAMPSTVGDLVRRAGAALDELAAVAAAVEDEYQYVADLVAAWSARLTRVGEDRHAEDAAAEVEAAVDRVALEASLVTDPHRAIDWLSTLPQVVLVALGERG